MADQEVVTPVEGMAYPFDDMYDMLKKYARSQGFAFVKFTRTVCRSGHLTRQVYACHRSGTRKPNDSLKERNTPAARMNCPVQVTVLRTSLNLWSISKVVLKHNHEIDPDYSRFIRQNRFIPSDVKLGLQLLDEAGVKTSKSIRVFTMKKGGPQNMTCLPTDCRNYVESVRRSTLTGNDAQSVHRLLSRMQQLSRDFFYRIDADEDGAMRNVFWVDVRSRAAYKEFKDVIGIDSTYLLNKFKMPFVPIIGVNHHGQTILLGCSLITNETAQTYEWLFKTWLEAMGGEPPAAIITDQCKSIGKGIELVFPNSRHRWCLWHILDKFPEKVGGNRRYKQLWDTFMSCVYDSMNIAEFETNWQDMVTEFQLEEKPWFQMLYEGREKWVPAFVKDYFWAGMSSTQRNESMNAYFDGYVTSRTTLRAFVKQFEIALGAKIEQEVGKDAKCNSRNIRCQTKFKIEEQFQQVYTLTMFKKVQDEITSMIYCEADMVTENSSLCEYLVTEREELGGTGVRLRKYKVMYDLQGGKVDCECRLFLWKGLLCRHAFKVMLKRNITSVPEQYILRRWRRDVKRDHSSIKLVGIGGKWTDEMNRLKKLESLFFTAADEAIDSSEKCQYLAKVLQDSRNNLIDGSWPRCVESDGQGVENPMFDENNDEPDNYDSTITYRDPKVVRSKGRPRQTGKRKWGGGRAKRPSKNPRNQQSGNTPTPTGQSIPNSPYLDRSPTSNMEMMTSPIMSPPFVNPQDLNSISMTELLMLQLG